MLAYVAGVRTPGRWIHPVSAHVHELSPICPTQATSVDSEWVSEWVNLVMERSEWRSLCKTSIEQFESDHIRALEVKWERRKTATIRSAACYPCQICGQTCASRIGLYSHSRTHQHWLRSGIRCVDGPVQQQQLVTDRRRHLPPRTRAPPRKQLSHMSALARVSYRGGMCPGRGQMSSTGADDDRTYSHARHLILMCCTSSLWASQSVMLCVAGKNQRPAAAAANGGSGGAVTADTVSPVQQQVCPSVCVCVSLSVCLVRHHHHHHRHF